MPLAFARHIRFFKGIVDLNCTKSMGTVVELN